MEQLLSSVHENLAIVGLAKNVGKTTSLHWVMDEASSLNKRLGLVSIGVDGEQQDVWDYHQKPAIFMQKGMWAVSAKAALQDSHARFRIHDELKASSPLGPVYLIECTHAGTVKLAGTHMMVDIQRAKHRFKQAGIELTLIDGAYDRLAAAAEDIAQHFILCTGAALDARLEIAMKKTEEIITRWQLPRWSGSVDGYTEDKFVHYLKDHTWQQLPITSVLNRLEGLRKLSASGIDALGIPGALTEGIMHAFLHIKQPFTWVVEDPTKLFLSLETMKRWYRVGGAINIRRKSNLCGIAVSPFSPYGSQANADEWLYAIKSISGDLPVIDARRRVVLR